MKQLLKRVHYTIYILLLTCTFCFSQIEFENDSNQEVIRVDFDSTKVKVGGVELLTIKMMVEYESECAKDSTFLGCKPVTVRDTLPDNLGGTTILQTMKLVDVYTPKDPTFKDFVRWVAKKYGL